MPQETFTVDLQSTRVPVAAAPNRWLGILQGCFARLRPPVRKLRLCESLSLGEKRTVAIVQFEGMRYLVGATPASITLLSRLPGEDSNTRTCQQRGAPCEP